MISNEHGKQTATNRAYLSKVLENAIFLGRQGLPFRGNWVESNEVGEVGSEVHSNFHQLLLLRERDDPSILDIMRRKSRKYIDHHIQNDLLQMLAVRHLRRIAAKITESGNFALEADEVTDSSNRNRSSCVCVG